MKHIIVSLFLSGCTTVVPVNTEFPKIPDTMKQKCSVLDKVKEDSQLSDVAKVITENYAKYHECSLRNDLWIEWYNTQKKTVESVK